MNFAHYVELAQLAERGLFDMLFVADNLTVWEGDESSIGHFSYVAWFEPITLMSALAAVTRHIGLVCTQTTTYDEPFLIARRFASLDMISGGRGGVEPGHLRQGRRGAAISAARRICRRTSATRGRASSPRW